MLRQLIRIIVLGVLMVLLVPTLAGAQSNVEFKGTVVRSPSVALASNGQILFELFESGKATPVYTAPLQSIGATAPPYNFTVVVGSSTFKSSSTYVLRATIAEGTVIRAQGSAPVANGGSTTLSIIALPATGTLPGTGSGDLILLVGLILAVIAGGLLLWYELRLRRAAPLAS